MLFLIGTIKRTSSWERRSVTPFCAGGLCSKWTLAVQTGVPLLGVWRNSSRDCDMYLYTFFYWSQACPPGWAPSNTQLSSPLWSRADPAGLAFVPACIGASAQNPGPHTAAVTSTISSRGLCTRCYTDHSHIYPQLFPAVVPQLHFLPSDSWDVDHNPRGLSFK